MQTNTGNIHALPVSPPCKRAAGSHRADQSVGCSRGHRAVDRRGTDHSAGTYRSLAKHKDRRQNGHSLQTKSGSISAQKHRSGNGKDDLTHTSAAQEPGHPVEAPSTDHLPFSLHQLHAFKTVVATGSKQQTADLLGVTGTNVSLMLNKLEKDFNEQLLIRSKGAPVQLTPAGQLLLRYTERMLSLCNDALTAAKDVQDIKTGTLTVGASQTTGVYLMPQLIGKTRRCPHTYVTVLPHMTHMMQLQ